MSARPCRAAAALIALVASQLGSPRPAQAQIFNQAQSFDPNPDLLAPSAADPVIEVGSGWYLRGDANIGEASLTLSNFGTLQAENFGADLGVGYQFGSSFRIDLTADYLTPATRARTAYFGGSGPAYSVPYAAIDPLAPRLGCPVGADPNNLANVFTVACSSTSTTSLRAQAYLLNAYLDIAHFGAVTPYIGAGAGLAHVDARADLNFQFSNGVAYGPQNSFCGGSTGLAGVSCYHLGYWNNSGPRSVENNFAYALMAGVAYKLSDLLTLDVGYRYLNLGAGLSAQEVRFGLRLTPDG